MMRKDHSRRTAHAWGLGGKADPSITPKAASDSLLPPPVHEGPGMHFTTGGDRGSSRAERTETAGSLRPPLAHRLPSTPRRPRLRDGNLPASAPPSPKAGQGPRRRSSGSGLSGTLDQQRLLPAPGLWVPHRRVGREAAGAGRARGGFREIPPSPPHPSAAGRAQPPCAR